jgi:hypothetical protein
MPTRHRPSCALPSATPLLGALALRSLPLAAILLGAAPAMSPPVAAQSRSSMTDARDGAVPREVAREVAAVWNATGTRRSRGPFALAAGDTVAGDLAVRDGDAALAGVVTGQVVVLNGSVTLGPSARIGGTLTVVGGVVTGPRDAVAGDVRSWRARLAWHEEDGVLVPEPEGDLEARWRRWRRGEPGRYSISEFFVASARTYNRVEGLPILAGPRLRVRNGDTRTTVELFGIFRTGERLVWEPDNLGHRVRAEVRQGRARGVSVSGRLFDEIDAVERWALPDGEAGLAAFLATRDFRDHWRRHGGEGAVTLHADERSGLTLALGEERWSSRLARDPWSLIDDKMPWRANPAVDEGVLRLFTVAGTLDTRNDDRDPTTGWLLRADYERGSGRLDVVAPTTSPSVRDTRVGDLAYGRLFLDLRRYNRLGPWASLNLRAVAGGWVHGDDLPMQRRLSVSGVDALPGFDFRRLLGEADVGTCATGGEVAYAALGRPAQCDRMVLLQAEWKGHFRVRIFGDEDDAEDDDRRWTASRVRADGAWVFFANSGRGWLRGDAPGDLQVGRGALPPLGTWRTDLGAGLDLGSMGLYVAKAVSEPGLSPNVFVRVRRRF